jgi:hypothetical protein
MESSLCVQVRKGAQARDPTALDDVIRKRNLQRANHLQVLMSTLFKLMGAAQHPSEKNKGATLMAALERREPDAVQQAKQAVKDWGDAAKEQKDAANRALAAATACVARDAAAHGNKTMGRSEAALPAAVPGGTDLVVLALDAYNAWAGRVGTDAAARETDLALQAMQEAAAGSFSPMLSGGQARGNAAAAVKAAMLRCGEALQAEFKAQKKDFLANMPCHLLISAGRTLVVQRTGEREGMERLHAVVSEIARELDMLQQSVDDTGVGWKRKGAAIEEFGRVSKKVKKTQGMRDLVRAQMQIQEADDDDDAGGDTIAELGVKLAAREAELREARDQKRLALSELAAVEPDFPEVMVHLEKALPRELLGVWRPDSALEEMFASREKLAGSHPLQNVWRCSDGEGGEEFAVKVHPSPTGLLCVATPCHKFRSQI